MAWLVHGRGAGRKGCKVRARLDDGGVGRWQLHSVTFCYKKSVVVFPGGRDDDGTGPVTLAGDGRKA